MDYINRSLEKNIKNSNKNKSSYWKKSFEGNPEYKNVFNSDIGIGKYQKNNLFSFIHNFFLEIIFGKSIFKTSSYKMYKSVFDRSNRRIDINTIRHIFTFEILKKYVNPKKICIIGDGGLNAVLGAYLIFPKSKIFSINLSESLIHDYNVLKNLNSNLKESVKLIENTNDFEEIKNLNLIPSNLKNYLFDREIDLFINISSFQEMSMNEINRYFEIIKNNKSYLYTCNREIKILPDGEKISFSSYPWANCNYVFNENCHFHQKYYSLKFPFIKKYDGNHKHALVKFN